MHIVRGIVLGLYDLVEGLCSLYNTITWSLTSFFFKVMSDEGKVKRNFLSLLNLRIEKYVRISPLSNTVDLSIKLRTVTLL